MIELKENRNLCQEAETSRPKHEQCFVDVLESEIKTQGGPRSAKGTDGSGSLGPTSNPAEPNPIPARPQNERLRNRLKSLVQQLIAKKKGKFDLCMAPSERITITMFFRQSEGPRF